MYKSEVYSKICRISNKISILTYLDALNTNMCILIAFNLKQMVKFENNQVLEIFIGQNISKLRKNIIDNQLY